MDFLGMEAGWMPKFSFTPDELKLLVGQADNSGESITDELTASLLRAMCTALAVAAELGKELQKAA